MEKPGNVGQGQPLHLAVQLLPGSRLHHHLPFLGTHRQDGYNRLACNRQLASQHSHNGIKDKPAVTMETRGKLGESEEK